MNKPRIRAALDAALALAVAPDGFTVADFTAKVRALTGQTNDAYTVRQAAYDLRKLRGKQLIVKPGRSHRYLVPQPAARTIAALLALRDHVIAPILAGVRIPRQGRPPAHSPSSTATTNTYASACAPSSNTSASAPSSRRRIDNKLSIPSRKRL